MSFIGTPCRYCGSNNLGIMSNYCNSFSQIVCSNCDSRGPRVQRESALGPTRPDQKAYAGWDKIHKEATHESRRST